MSGFCAGEKRINTPEGSYSGTKAAVIMRKGEGISIGETGKE